MNQYVFKTTALIAFIALVIISNYSTHAQAASSENTLTHCTWGDIGCNNPPPKSVPYTAAPKSTNKADSKSLPIKPTTSMQPKTFIGSPNIAKVCDKDLSSPGECWTNCKTEEEITICDIIKLDTFMPESPMAGLTNFKSEDWVFSGKIVTKIYLENKAAKGRIMINKK